MKQINVASQAQNVALIKSDRMKKADGNVAMQQKGSPSLAGQFLKAYREKKHLTQEQLAEDLHVEPRTLRAWENGERQLTNINELYRIADLLGVEPEQLGLANSLVIPRTPEQIEEIIDHAWSLVDQSRLYEARRVIERLAQQIRSQITTEDPVLLRSLAHTYHNAGYVISEATQAHESYEAILYYQQMETIARILKDDTLVNIALTYQGDMYRRLGDLGKAITYLEAARDTTPKADKAALGNSLQLLARAYVRNGELGNFEYTMRQTEALAYEIELTTSSTRGHYGPGTVYEEYGRSYADLGQAAKAKEYLDKAEATLPHNAFWDLLILTSRAVALVKGNEIQSGVDLAIEATEKIKQVGILRYLDRIHLINRYLENLERQIGTLRKPLQEALYVNRAIDY
jgi:transcriptional regulator with XRE-family HTH domain